jgi:hypothetical protein
MHTTSNSMLLWCVTCTTGICRSRLEFAIRAFAALTITISLPVAVSMANAAASSVAPCVEGAVEDTPVIIQMLSPSEVQAQLEADAAYAAELQVSLQKVRDDKLIIGPLMESEVHEMLDKVPHRLTNKVVLEFFWFHISQSVSVGGGVACVLHVTHPRTHNHGTSLVLCYSSCRYLRFSSALRLGGSASGASVPVALARQRCEPIYTPSHKLRDDVSTHHVGGRHTSEGTSIGVRGCLVGLWYAL